MLFLNKGTKVFKESGPKHSANLAAAFVAPYLTSLLSSSNKSIIYDNNLVEVTSFGKMLTIIDITSVTPARTYGTKSFAKYCKCGTIIPSFSGERIFTNFVKDYIEAILTSFSASLSKFVKI
jgi:hypothetical protein